mgnify:CR=1 FL=1
MDIAKSPTTFIQLFASLIIHILSSEFLFGLKWMYGEDSQVSGFPRLDIKFFWEKSHLVRFFLGKFTYFWFDSYVILFDINTLIFAMWSSNTYSRCLLSRRSQLQALNDCSSYTVVGLPRWRWWRRGAEARRFANGFFLKQEIVSSLRRRRRRHAMCLVALSAENSKHSCYDISRLLSWLGSSGRFF